MPLIGKTRACSSKSRVSSPGPDRLALPKATERSSGRSYAPCRRPPGLPSHCRASCCVGPMARRRSRSTPSRSRRSRARRNTRPTSGETPRWRAPWSLRAPLNREGGISILRRRPRFRAGDCGRNVAAGRTPRPQEHENAGRRQARRLSRTRHEPAEEHSQRALDRQRVPARGQAGSGGAAFGLEERGLIRRVASQLRNRR